MADWLKDTLIRSLGIWHVFSKEGSPFCWGARRTLPPPLLTLLALVPHVPDSEQNDGPRDDLCHRLLTCEGLMATTRKLLHHLTLFLCLILVCLFFPLFPSLLPPPNIQHTCHHTLSHTCPSLHGGFQLPEVNSLLDSSVKALHQRQWQIAL